MHDHNAFNGNNDKNGIPTRRVKEVRIRGMEYVDQFSASGRPTCRKIGHATRSDMFRGKKEKGESSSIRHIDRKAGNECSSSSSSSSVGLFTGRQKGKRGKQLHLLVDEKEGSSSIDMSTRKRGTDSIVLVSGKRGTTFCRPPLD